VTAEKNTEPAELHENSMQHHGNAIWQIAIFPVTSPSPKKMKSFNTNEIHQIWHA
jgi:hypothetical protein